MLAVALAATSVGLLAVALGLAFALARHKARAAAALRAAEEAGRARTRYFVAASHDLRQPLHALGLFAKALRERPHADAQLAQLARDIAGSVEALEALFAELLDLTRIDAGGVQPRPEPFRVGALFERLALHFGPSAFDKGLRLAFRGGGHWACADPLLVDRVVRNLLANAIRYTTDGGVLVACRRRGERLLLQVWDSGVGIEAHEQARVFDEFYRAGGARQDGLGLGLAIAQRLAVLMDARLSLRSTPGRGTVFTLEVPATAAVSGNAAAAPAATLVPRPRP